MHLGRGFRHRSAADGVATAPQLVANATAGRLPYVSYSADKKLSARPFDEIVEEVTARTIKAIDSGKRTRKKVVAPEVQWRESVAAARTQGGR